MNKILLIPLKGIEIFLNNKSTISIILGTSKEEIIKLLGVPLNITKGNYYPEDTYYFYNNSLQLSFYKGEILSYVEIFYDLSDNVSIDNIKVFEHNADLVLNELFKKYGKFDELFKGTSYINYQNSIAFGRPLTPEDIEEDLGENDYQKGIKFSTVGIGVEGYFND